MTVDGPPFSEPRYLHLDLGRLNSATWQVSGYVPLCCVLRQEAGNIMMVPVISVLVGNSRRKTRSFPVSLHANVYLRLQFADLFHDLPLAHKITVNQTGAFYFSQACSEVVFNFFQRQTNDSYRFISELMDVFCMAGVHQRPEQSNYLAEDQI